VLKILLEQYLKSLFRSPRFDSNWIFRILITIALLNFCVVVFFFGIEFTKLLFKIQPYANPIKYVNEGLVYLIPIDLLLRFFFQKNNFINLRYYLHLPINRSKLISYILGLELFNVFNIYIILFMIPFAWVNVLPDFGWLSLSFYLLNILLVLVVLTYITFFLRSISDRNILFALIPLAGIIIVIFLRVFFRQELWNLSEVLFENILHKNYLSILLFALLILLTMIFDISMIKQFIYNIFTNEGKLEFKNSKSTLLNKSFNPYILLEINLMLRNKRIRSMITIPLYIILMTYILFLLKPIYDINTLFFWCLCLSGVWGYSYLQYVFSFESSFFDFISAVNFDFQKYLKTKYTIVVLFNLIVVIITLPVLIIRNMDLYIVASAFLYNIGIGFFIIFFSGTFNNAKMNLTETLLFNFQGNNPTQIISISIVIILPLAFLIIISTFLKQSYGLIILNLISIISLLNFKKWFQVIYRQMSKKKYTNLEGFRR